jgi:hypothetical protein
MYARHLESALSAARLAHEMKRDHGCSDDDEQAARDESQRKPVQRPIGPVARVAGATELFRGIVGVDALRAQPNASFRFRCKQPKRSQCQSPPVRGAVFVVAVLDPGYRPGAPGARHREVHMARQPDHRWRGVRCELWIALPNCGGGHRIAERLFAANDVLNRPPR